MCLGRFAVAAFDVNLNGIGHFQCGVIRDLLNGEKAAGNITVIAVPKIIFVCAFPMLAELSYTCRCVPHHCWPLWPDYKSWKLLAGKPLNASEGELETMMRAAESIELFQSLVS